MQPQDDRPLWDLLKPLSAPEVSAQFADDVLRKIRSGVQPKETSLADWLMESWKALLGIGGMAAMLAVSLVFLENRAPTLRMTASNSPAFSSLVASNGDFSDLKDIDNDLDDNDIWLGTDTSY